jgi:glycosyltransferase involved in cell wall biosynthesis
MPSIEKALEAPAAGGSGPVTRPIRVCQAASAAISVYYLLRGQIQALAAAGYEVRAVSGADDWTAKNVSVGLVADIAPMVRELSPVRDAIAFVWLVRYFRRWRFDVVHTHTPKAGLIAPLAARIAGVPCILHTVHGFLFHDRMKRPRWLAGWLAEKFTALWVDALLFQSREDWESAPKRHILPARRCFYIGNGVDVTRYTSSGPDTRREARALLGIGPDEFVVGYAGRLVREKGVEDLLYCAERFVAGKQKVRILLVGSLEEKEQSDSLTAAELENWRSRLPALFPGHREDLHRLYAAMDVFVLPSYREGLPRALTEACLAGIPAIATDIRGCREVVEDRVTGLLFPAGDRERLSMALEEVYSHPEEAGARAKNARERTARQFDETVVTRRIMDVYRQFTPQVPQPRAMEATAGVSNDPS